MMASNSPLCRSIGISEKTSSNGEYQHQSRSAHFCLQGQEKSYQISSHSNSTSTSRRYICCHRDAQCSQPVCANSILQPSSSSYSVRSPHHGHSKIFNRSSNGMHSLYSFGSFRKDQPPQIGESAISSIRHSRILKPSGGSSAGGISPAHATLLEKKRKLYRETQQLPLWGIRKVTINPIDRDDLSRFPDNSLVTCRYKVRQ